MTDPATPHIQRKLFPIGEPGEYRRWTFEPREYPVLPEAIREQLRHLAPTVRADGQRYWPVQAVLHDGRTVDSVCLMDAGTYMASFQRPWPELFRDTATVSVLDIATLRECPCRLPARLAEKLMNSEEFRVGATSYSLCLKDGATWPVATDGLLDFTCLPDGLCSDDIVDVTPAISGDLHHVGCITWCLADFGELELLSNS